MKIQGEGGRWTLFSLNSRCRNTMFNCHFFRNLPHNFIIHSDVLQSLCSYVLPLGRRNVANEAGSAQICLMTRKADSSVLTTFGQRHLLFSTLLHSSRNCSDKPVWMQRCWASLANKNCWFLCLRFRTSAFACEVVACGTTCSLYNLASSQNRDSLFSEERAACLYQW